MMARNENQNLMGQIQWSADLLDDERIAELIAQKGMAGLGVYMCVIGEMYRRPSRCLTLTQIKALKFAGATQKTILSVVNGFGLFGDDKKGHVYSNIDFSCVDGTVGSESDSNQIATVCESDSNQIAIACESPSIPTPVRPCVRPLEVEEDEKKEIKKENILLLLQDTGVSASEDFIAKIPQKSQWTEVALMKSGFGPLIQRNWQVTLDAFRNHTIANCSTENIRSLKDAKKYFLYYITHPTSGSKLRQLLEEHERQHPEVNPFRFEDASSTVGNRRYHGIALPDDAPPRPNERVDWDSENHCWS